MEPRLPPHTQQQREVAVSCFSASQPQWSASCSCGSRRRDIGQYRHRPGKVASHADGIPRASPKQGMRRALGSAGQHLAVLRLYRHRRLQARPAQGTTSLLLLVSLAVGDSRWDYLLMGYSSAVWFVSGMHGESLSSACFLSGLRSESVPSDVEVLSVLVAGEIDGENGRSQLPSVQFMMER